MSRSINGWVSALLVGSATWYAPLPAVADPAQATVPGVIDLHVDLPYALAGHKHAFDDAASATSPARLARGKVGTLVLPLFVLDAHAMTPSHARQEYQAVFSELQQALQSPAGQRTMTAPDSTAQQGKVATVLSFEGADGFADRPDDIVPWITRGVCFVGLVHRQNNSLSGSATDPNRIKRAVGLTDRGKALAEVVAQHGGVLDAAHASDAATDDLVAIARKHQAPVVVTHTGMRALRATGRNVDDAHLQAIASTGGVAGIDIHSGHIGRQPGGPATLDDVVAHIEHAVAVAGIDHVAIGSDLEGGISPPTDSDGAATWPLLASKLTARGWNGESIEALFRGNAARVLGWSRAHGCGPR
jgi:membrane dipeptidase